MAGLLQPAASLCEKQLQKMTAKFSVGKSNDVKTMNVCMTSATVFLSNNPDGAALVPLRTWNPWYIGVSKQDIKKVRAI